MRTDPVTPKFAIFYADGTVHEGGGADDEFIDVTLRVSRDWLNAPADRVLGIIVEKPHRQVLRSTRKDNSSDGELFGVEWYYPLGQGEYGFADDLGAWLRKLGGVVKRGEYVSSERMAAFWGWANGYMGIPRP